MTVADLRGFDAISEAERETDARFRTDDGVLIVDGLRVWDNGLNAGTVAFAETGRSYATCWNGWFRVRRDKGGHSLMDRQRLSTRHPFTGQAPPQVPGKTE
jgi:hypothetical protein